MPNSQQVITNAANIAINTQVISYLLDLVKIIGPFITVIIGLVVWAWKKMEKTQEKMENAFTDHVKEDDEIHDKIFTQQRESDAKLNELLGEHHAMHTNGKD